MTTFPHLPCQEPARTVIMNYDVIVVGAGPAGSAAARECAQLGLSTLCLEEHGTIGYPVQCAGLLSTCGIC